MVIGGLLLIAALVAAFTRETMSPPQITLVRTIQSLGGGLLAAGFAGFLTVSGSIAGLALRAGGPMAVFVLLYLTDPSASVAEAGATPERKKATEEIALLQAQLADTPVTIVANGGETTVPGSDAVQEIARTEAKLDPSQLMRSASKEELDRIAASLRKVRDSRRLDMVRMPMHH